MTETTIEQQPEATPVEEPQVCQNGEKQEPSETVPATNGDGAHEEEAKKECNGQNGEVHENDETADAAPGNEDEPKATSTPVKTKAKRRQVMANMRAAFARLKLGDQIRTLSQKMKRAPKQKKEKEVNGEEKVEATENGKIENGATERTNGEEKCEDGQQKEETQANGHATEQSEEQPTEDALETSSPAVVSSDTQQAVVAQ